MVHVQELNQTDECSPQIPTENRKSEVINQEIYNAQKNSPYQKPQDSGYSWFVGYPKNIK